MTVRERQLGGLVETGAVITILLASVQLLGACHCYLVATGQWWQTVELEP